MKRSHYHSGAIGYHGHRAPSSGKAPALKVKGNKIINVDTGMPYLMIGVSQDGAEYSCIKLGVVMGGADTMPMNEETITLLKQQWYVNTVRIPMNSACLLDLDHGPTQARGSAYLGAIHRYVDKLIEAGITPILDLHWTEATTTATTTTDQQDYPNVQHSIPFWQTMGKAFAGYNNVVFELFNEPKQTDEKQWPCLQYGECTAGAFPYEVAGMKQMIYAVRHAGFHGLVLCAGLDWANDLTEWADYPLKDENVAASIHVYNRKNCGGASCVENVLSRLSKLFPIVTTEFGSYDNSGQYITDYMQAATTVGIGCIAWAFNIRSNDDPHLITDKQGTPSAAGLAFQAFAKKIQSGQVNPSTAHGREYGSSSPNQLHGKVQPKGVEHLNDLRKPVRPYSTFH